MFGDLMWWLVVITPAVLPIIFFIWKLERDSSRSDDPFIGHSRVPVPIPSDHIEINRRQKPR
ncbi:MAG TPA: hypothetical protein VK452_06390 [Dissulfurispiraceae bacterium]|nr:hypothetical protein [Dissulfurispiraceae bacterium]